MCWADGAIQEISARIGRVTGQGITGNIRALPPLALLLIVNTINLGADLGAMAAALKLADRRPTGPLGVCYE